MLKDLAISLLDQAMSVYCSQQPMSASLAAYRGKSLVIECTDVAVTVLVEVSERLRFSRFQEQPCDCHIKGNYASLLQLQDTEQFADLVKTEAVWLQGDIQLASKVADELRQTQFDSEEWLSQYLGDVPAYMLANSVRKLSRWGQSRRQTFNADIQEYMQDEIKWLPATAEFRQFNQQVDELAQRCEQLSLRISKLRK